MKYLILLFILFVCFSVSVSAQDRNEDGIVKVYQKNVPHIDKNGNKLTKYSKTKSFFPIALWGVPGEGEVYGKYYDWNEIQSAGFNTVWTWGSYGVQDVLAMGEKHNLQVVVMNPRSDEELKFADSHPNMLGNVWTDEPIGRFGNGMDQLFDDYKKYISNAKKIAPNVKVFVNDAPWITEPATEWWIKWNTYGAFACHDSYPIYNVNGEAARSLAQGHNMPASVDFSVSVNKEAKPQWIIVGAFDQPSEYGSSYPFRYPTPNQLRACVYTAIIHGATGIVYFAWDSFITREGNVIAMAPNPQTDMGNGDPKYAIAKPSELVNGQACWEMTAQINKELNELAPVILSPTSKAKYTMEVTGESVTDVPIHTLLKEDSEGNYILITANVDASWLKTEYKFSGIKEAEKLYEDGK
ncbi:MAG: hypothetical protein KBT47_08540, partial [Armatimonadetes bacterium]|nr:hypothetical protein [Candidatus Hippobium faecium]